MHTFTYSFPILALAAGISYAGSSLAQTQPHTTAPSGMVPQTGSAQGVNSHNSQPMPSGMAMPKGQASQAPMVTSPSGVVPQTGSEQGANSHNSQPMPSGMVMPNNRASQGPMAAGPHGSGPQQEALRPNASEHLSDSSALHSSRPFPGSKGTSQTEPTRCASSLVEAIQPAAYRGFDVMKHGLWCAKSAGGDL